ncbi:hypothetical protein DKX38_001719 [Salix brachista]|uniref:Uncharacterized protein n=1 Tax=Salix brachista TaxID=2182728 RepID=A0A5N5P459_9ROSI|nr:hypothetical protein DKX38_001719 [Salix brachista]
MPLSPATTTAGVISTGSHLCQARLILEHQNLCDHSNLSLVHLQTLTTSFVCKQQQRQRTARVATMVKFLKTTKAVIILQGKYTGHKVVIARSFDDDTRDHAYDHWLVAGIKKYLSKVNQAISGNVRNNGGGRSSASSNSTRSCVASPLDQLTSKSYLWATQFVSMQKQQQITAQFLKPIRGHHRNVFA